ncbi:MAG: glycosyltransferase [Candidatus Altiarchaeota archaeon]|nr:glycosyltransferase [Candidatus Altiarchaeota archaeon]
MKIGIFTDTYFPQINGVTFTIHLWKEKLEELGHTVRIYYPSGKYAPKDGEYPFRSFEFRFYKGYRIAIPTDLMDKTEDLDIIHIHGLFSMAIAGMWVSRKRKIPRALTYHTPADEYIEYITRRDSLRKTLMRIYNMWEKQLLNSCDLVTCPSKVIRDRLLAKGVKDAIVLSNGVDLGFFRPVDAEGFRDKYGIGDGRVIGFCGRMGYEKHVEDLIGIADEFDGEILIAGNGPAEEHYRELGKEKTNVRFLGFLERQELLEFYSALDVFIFPSVAETQGLVALESMACGKPIVGADALALKDTIVDGVNGYLYQSGDRRELLEKIDMAYENRETLSRNCIEYVKQHSVDRSMERLVELYQGLDTKKDG